jgi:hypothetical protein
MSTTLEAPIAVQDAPLSPDDEERTLSTALSPAAHLQALERPKRGFFLRILAPGVSGASLGQLPLEVTVRPVVNSFDRVARDFPDLFILASLC